MHDQLSRLVGAAKWFAQEHENVKDNPKKLLAADKKGVAEITRVGDECARGMETYEKARVVLNETAKHFLDGVAETPLGVNPFPGADRRHIEIAFAAVRFVTAELESSFCPMHSSRTKDYTPADRRAVDRYFKYREELVQLVKELK